MATPTGPFSLGNLINVMSGGRDPSWTRITTFQATDRPRDLTDGVDLLTGSPDGRGYVFAKLSLGAWDQPHRRTAAIAVPSFSAAGTYTVVVDGAGSAAVATPATEAALLTDLTAAINTAYGAAGTDVLVATEVDSDGDGTNDAILITGNPDSGAAGSFGVTVSTSGGGSLLCIADAVTAAVDLYVLPIGAAARAATGVQTKPYWRKIAGGSLTGLDRDGYFQNLNVSGVARIYSQTTATTQDANDGAGAGGTFVVVPSAHIGPCGTEGQS